MKQFMNKDTARKFKVFDSRYHYHYVLNVIYIKCIKAVNNMSLYMLELYQLWL